MAANLRMHCIFTLMGCNKNKLSAKHILNYCKTQLVLEKTWHPCRLITTLIFIKVLFSYNVRTGNNVHVQKQWKFLKSINADGVIFQQLPSPLHHQQNDTGY